MPAKHLVLDSWPILEWLKGREPASRRVRTLIEGAILGEIVLSMSRMNYGEVLYNVRKDLPEPFADLSLIAFRQIPIQFHSVDDQIVEDAARIKGAFSISYADAFAAALALRLGVPVVTGDVDFRKLGVLQVQLHWVGA